MANEPHHQQTAQEKTAQDKAAAQAASEKQAAERTAAQDRTADRIAQGLAPEPPVPPEGWPAIKIVEKDGVWAYARDAFMDDHGVTGTLPPHVTSREAAEAHLTALYPGATFA
jgi:guanyl-specific ribonuclease Sa